MLSASTITCGNGVPPVSAPVSCFTTWTGCTNLTFSTTLPLSTLILSNRSRRAATPFFPSGSSAGPTLNRQPSTRPRHRHSSAPALHRQRLRRAALHAPTRLNSIPSLGGTAPRYLVSKAGLDRQTRGYGLGERPSGLYAL